MDTMKRSLWHKVTSYVLTAFMMMQLTLPSVASAMTSISNSQLNDELTAEQMFMRSALAPYLYERSRYIPKLPSSYANQTIEELHTKLKANHTSRLKSEIATDWIPIAGDITIFIPKERTIYPLYKQVGDKFVQRKVVGNQIKRLIGRTYYKSGFTSEQAQIHQLYTNAYTLASKTTFKYQLGDTLPEGIADTLKTDFIWPESRNIGGQYVLVPVVHLQTATVDKKGIDGTHTVEFKKSNATFRSAKISNADLKLQNETVFRTINDLVIGTKSSISIDDSAARIYAGVSFIDNGSGSVQGVASGTLYNYGQINSARNVDIVAGNYQQKTFVHRFKTAHGYEDRLGSISAINAGGGISIRTYGDILLEGATVAANGGSINLYANGNISIGAVALENSSSFKVKGGKKNAQGVNYVQSILSAQDNISLYAAGIIEINASELHAEEGAIQVLAQNGIYILNEFDQSSSNMDRKWRKTTETEQQFETIAIRSVLEAGKGVTIASDYGDITLKATKITSGDGTEISAHNGRVNLLLAKEQDHYYYNKVRKGFWKIKTETKQDTTDTAVYNEVIGGVKVHATHGITLELGQYEGESVTDVINQFAGSDSLSWMADIYNDPKYNCPAPTQPPRDDFYSRTVFEAIQQDADFNNCTSMLDVVYKKLEDIHIHEKTSNLSPAAMAIIAIAVSVAMGPAGAQWIGSKGAIAGAFKSAAMGAAMSAGAVTLATSVATSLANGDGIDGAIKKITSSDGLRSLAISMATAGVLNSEAMKSLDFFKNADFTSSFFSSQDAIDIAKQATQAVTTATVRAGISTIINGGDLDSFKEQFLGALAAHAIAEIGEKLATEIGEAVNHEPPKINEITRYLAHAGVGCLTGTLTAEVNNSEKGLGCASGAGGAVIGELVAEAHKKIKNVDELEKVIKVKQAKVEELLGLDHLDDINTLTDEQRLILEANLESLGNLDYSKAKLLQLKAEGVDLAKLGAGLAAFMARGEVNIAADAGENAAEHNAFWFVVQGAYLLWKAYDAIEAAKKIIAIGNRLNKVKNLPAGQQAAARNELIMELGYAILGDVVLGKAPEVVLKKIKQFAQKTEIGSQLSLQLDQVIDSIEKKVDYKVANYRDPKFDDPKYVSNSGFSDEALPDDQTGNLKKAVIKKDTYTNAELELLKHSDGAHTLEKHGPHVTDEHLVHRLATGVAPDGTKGRSVPPYSSKFDSPESLRDALQKVSPDNPEIKAKLDAQLKAGKTSLGGEVFDMNKTIGYGYQRIGNSKKPSPGQFKQAPAPTPQNRHSMNQVQVTYVYDDSKSTWYIMTMFPTKKTGG